MIIILIVVNMLLHFQCKYIIIVLKIIIVCNMVSLITENIIILNYYIYSENRIYFTNVYLYNLFYLLILVKYRFLYNCTISMEISGCCSITK